MYSKEIWKQIPGYNGDYKISNLGKVKSLKNNKVKLLKTSPIHGYPAVWLCSNGIGERIRTAKLVLMSFIGPCPIGKQVSHIKGIRKDSRLKNLKYETSQENINRIKRFKIKIFSFRINIVIWRLHD